MSDHPQKPELDNEQRYMALLALTSQELPAKSSTDGDSGETLQSPVGRQDKLYDRLAADPAALEDFLRRERRSVEPRSSATGRSFGASLSALSARWTAIAPVRYAMAFGVAALVSFLVLLQFGDGNRLQESVERSFVGVTLQSAEPIVLPWEQPTAVVGFAPNGARSKAAVEFANGLLRGRELLAAGKGRIASDSTYAALGEWNMLLSAVVDDRVATVKPDTRFWEEQVRIVSSLLDAEFDESDTAAIRAHLHRADALITTLAKGENVARNGRTLANELLLFREQFAPHDKAALGNL